MTAESTMKRDSFAFSLVFEGLALDDHTMAVESFAPALLSLSSLISTINKKANQEKVDAQLAVNAQFVAGSFGIELILNQSILGVVTSVFASQGVTAFVNAYGIFCALRDLVTLKKALNGQSPDEVKRDGENVIIKVKNINITIGTLAYEAFIDEKANDACNRVVAPLAETGIDRVRFRSREGEDVSVEKEELAGFVASANKEILAENVRRIGLVITSLNFNEGTKWRVTLGEKTPIFTTISDKEFLQRVDAGIESFRKGDILMAELKETQTVQNGKVAVAYDVVKVLEHRHAFQQIDMDFGK